MLIQPLAQGGLEGWGQHSRGDPSVQANIEALLQGAIQLAPGCIATLHTSTLQSSESSPEVMRLLSM